jgi:hypothetical protein
MERALTAIFSVAILALLMVGCATTRLVDSDVTAFSSWRSAPPGPGTPYRFERLPSQQLAGAQQDLVEGLAHKALARVGLTLDSPAARYSVQVMLTTLVVDRLPYYGGGYGGYGFGRPGVFGGHGYRGGAFGMSYPLYFPEPYFRRELHIVMRDLSNGQIVFETQALHDGIWSDTLAVLPAMLDAALLGFPQPPPGTRRVNIEIPH